MSQNNGAPGVFPLILYPANGNFASAFCKEKHIFRYSLNYLMQYASVKEKTVTSPFSMDFDKPDALFYVHAVGKHHVKHQEETL